MMACGSRRVKPVQQSPPTPALNRGQMPRLGQSGSAIADVQARDLRNPAESDPGEGPCRGTLLVTEQIVRATLEFNEIEKLIIAAQATT
jgi:hypothetical protein